MAVGDIEGLVVTAREQGCDLVVVGPEAPLVGGLVDQLAGGGVRAFGPSAAAARIEGSKAYAKEIMEAAGVQTAGHVVLRDLETALVELVEASYPLVLKADVLAAGKGVVICADEAEARGALEDFFLERRFGETTVVLEEFLEGEELSLLALCDGERAVAMTPARDFKRIGEGDTGPNTGGMGSYSPVADVDAERAHELVSLIHQPVVDELRRRGTPYHGVLYAGLMLTASGPSTLEFNCRFGDPETQCVLPRLRSDLLDLLERSVQPGGSRELSSSGPRSRRSPSSWPPGRIRVSSSLGDRISGLEEAGSAEGVEVLHAGTADDGRGGFVTAGGRVLNVTGTGATLTEARGRAYAAAGQIAFDGLQLRGDIAAEAAERVGA